MPAGGRMAYEDALSPVGLTQGDLADTVYQGADPNAVEPPEGGCNCPCMDMMEPEMMEPPPSMEAPPEAPGGALDALLGGF